MNQLEQGSAGISLASSALTLQQPTPQTARFLEMARSALATPKQPTQDMSTERPQQPKPDWKPPVAYKDASGPLALFGTLEALEAHKASQRPQRLPQPPELASLLDLDALRPTRGRGAGTEGAGALARELDRLARITLDACPFLYKDGQTPAQIVLHLPAEYLGVRLRVSCEAVRGWAAQLKTTGYLHSKPHKTSSVWEGETRTVLDGTLYAVRLAPGHTARLSYADLARQYRDLDADREAGRTAHNVLNNALKRAQEADEKNAVLHNENAIHDDGKEILGSHIKIPVRVGKQKIDLTPSSAKQLQEEIGEALAVWAVIPGSIPSKIPVINTMTTKYSLAGITAALNTVQDVVYTVPLLADCPYDVRPDLVAALATVMSRELDRGNNHAAFCGLVWEAYRRERAGLEGLDSLERVLRRVMVARREWKGIRNPAALLFTWWRAEVGGPSAAELVSAAD